MRKGLLFSAILPLIILFFVGTSYSWLGRMGGMGGPFGLVEDESDYLIHPAKIAKGEGIKFYGHYCFTYTDVMDWDYYKEWSGDRTGWIDYDFSGDELRHDAQVGAAFPLGMGRMGLFFSYEGLRDDYDGDNIAFDQTIELDSHLDAFTLRLMYGLPLGAFNLGGEVQIAYCQDEHEIFIIDFSPLFPPSGYYNVFSFLFDFFPYVPYDSEYWEALFKGSLEGPLGPADVEFTVRGGFVFAGDNEVAHEQQSTLGTPDAGYDMDGAVEGWRIGGDLWVRYPLAKDLTLPFLVRVDFQEKTRDGDGPGSLAYVASNFFYESTEKSLDMTVGGGVDKELAADTKIAAGIYYRYFRQKDDLSFTKVGFGYSSDTTFPDWTEHQIIVRLAGEHELTPAVALRAGLNFFYGWVSREGNRYSLTESGLWYDDKISAGGPHWGIGASLGGAIRLQHFTLEPFVTAGYQELDLDGDGTQVDNVYPPSINIAIVKDDYARREWSIGGGFSVLFDLP